MLAEGSCQVCGAWLETYGCTPDVCRFVQKATQSDTTTWIEDGLTFRELIRQPYTNCVFSAGTVEGHPVDTLYLKWERDGEGRMLLLRPDEAAALAWCLTGALWSILVQE